MLDNLRKEVAEHIEYNNVYGALREVAEFINLDEKGFQELYEIEKEHRRVGHLNSFIEYERNVFKETLKYTFLGVHNIEGKRYVFTIKDWKSLRI